MNKKQIEKMLTLSPIEQRIYKYIVENEKGGEVLLIPADLIKPSGFNQSTIYKGLKGLTDNGIISPIEDSKYRFKFNEDK
jgi:predicted transcriptional regulator